MTTEHLCECGCGLPTNLAPQSMTRKGWVRGQPLRFRQGHYAKLNAANVEPLSARWDVDSNGCWVWRGNRSDGYGYITRQRRRLRAHRVVYEELAGPIAEGMTLDHLCRNRACVNPAHLEPVTTQENTRRGNAERTHCKRGHPLSGDNLYLHSGRRHCRACRSAHRRGRYAISTKY